MYKKSYILFIIVLIEGFISIGVEIFAIRQMIPFVGSNILNTSIIIGVFLLFLSFGYYKGGLIDTKYEKVLLNNLINSTILISFGLSNLFLSWYFSLFKSIGNIYGLIIFTFVVIAPITYLLGQTIPIVTNFIKSENNSKTNGTLLFYSTIGSFLGSIITTTVLLNFLGVQRTLLCYILILLVLILFLTRLIKINKLFLVGRFLLIVFITLIVNSKQLYLYSNEYSSVQIKKDIDNIKYLAINNSFSSSFDKKTNNSSFECVLMIQENIKKIDNQKKKDILVIGAGGFTVSLVDNFNNYTYIDIDKDLKAYTEKYFLNSKINGKFIVEDVRYYFTKDKMKYNIIVLDAFSNKVTIPTFLLTDDFFMELRKHLKDDGTLVINFIGSPKFKNLYTRHFNQTVNKSFNCLVEAVDLDKKITNMIYTCSSKNDNIVYTDDKINLFELVQ